MQDNLKGSQNCNAKPEPYMLYRRDQSVQGENQPAMHLKDLEYFQDLYPARMKKLQRYVSDACDKLEYKNSPMYDQYPDRVMIQQVCDEICNVVSNSGDIQEDRVFNESTEAEEVEVYEVSRAWGPPSPPPPRPPWGPPPPPPPRPPWGPPPHRRQGRHRIQITG